MITSQSISFEQIKINKRPFGLVYLTKAGDVVASKYFNIYQKSFFCSEISERLLSSVLKHTDNSHDML